MIIQRQLPIDAINITIADFCGIKSLCWNDSKFPVQTTGLNTVNSIWLIPKGDWKIKEINKEKLVTMEIVEIQEREDERCPECGGELIEVEVPRVPLKNKPLAPDKVNFIKLQCSLCTYYTMKETPMDKAIRVGVLDDAETSINPSDFQEDGDE